MTLGTLSPPVPHARPFVAPEPHTGVKRAGVFPQPKPQTEVWGPVTQELPVRPPRHPGHVSPSSWGPLRDVVPLDLGPVLVCLLTLAVQGQRAGPTRGSWESPCSVSRLRLVETRARHFAGNASFSDTCTLCERYTNEDWVKSTTFPPAASLSAQVCTPAAREPGALTVRCVPSGLRVPFPAWEETHVRGQAPLPGLLLTPVSRGNSQTATCALSKHPSQWFSLNVQRHAVTATPKPRTTSPPRKETLSSSAITPQPHRQPRHSVTWKSTLSGPTWRTGVVVCGAGSWHGVF